MAGTRTIKKRNQPVKNDQLLILTKSLQWNGIKVIIDYFISTKVSEGCCPRTITDYSNSWRYFTDWLFIPDVEKRVIRGKLEV